MWYCGCMDGRKDEWGSLSPRLQIAVVIKKYENKCFIGIRPVKGYVYQIYYGKIVK